MEYPPELVNKKILQILNAYKDKNFVQRILNPENYPSIDNGDGTYSTHRMSYGEIDGKQIVFPNIIQNKNTNQLTELTPNDAFKYAVQNNEYIPFNKPETADWFSKNYKSIWKKKKQISGILGQFGL